MNAALGVYDKAIALLRAGQVIVLPTETVYGLAACAHIDGAVLDVFAVKQRPPSHPVSLCVLSAQQAETLCHVSDLAQRFMDDFWPGPLTLVLPKKDGANISAHLSSLDTIGLRCPDAKWRKAFAARGFTTPLALTSANTSGQPSPIRAEDIEDSIAGPLSLVVNGGTCKGAKDSTVIRIENDRAHLLRHGAIPPESFAPYPLDWPSP